MAVTAMTMGPMMVSAAGAGSQTATTSLTQPSTSGTTDQIILKAKFEMRAKRAGDLAYNALGNKAVGFWTDTNQYDNWWYEDNLTTPGGQFMPSGDETINTPVAICAVVAHPLLKANLTRFSVSADTDYPNVKGLGLTKEFCGNRKNEIELQALARVDGLRLVCGYDTYTGVKDRDPGLVTIYPGHNWADICEEIDQEQAKVFCGINVLSYEDPAGDYKVTAIATLDGGNRITGENTFQYLPLDAFKTDFTNVNYGNTVTIGNLASVDGDADMTTPLKPTVRETGNRVLTLHVAQDDMGFDQRILPVGTTVWNVHYKARLGSTPEWALLSAYDPSVKAGSPIVGGGYTLDNKLDLSEIKKLDFGIIVDKFPYEPGYQYGGNLVITATGSLESCSN